MKKLIPFWSLLAGILTLAGCVAVMVATPPPASGPKPASPGQAKKAGRPGLGIPPGHLPPPGKCRIWYPGMPPGKQPKPGPCARLAGQVPPGAWLISRTGKDRKQVQVSEYDPHRKNVVLIVRLFEAATGKFISERTP